MAPAQISDVFDECVGPAVLEFSPSDLVAVGGVVVVMIIMMVMVVVMTITLMARVHKKMPETELTFIMMQS